MPRLLLPFIALLSLIAASGLTARAAVPVGQPPLPVIVSIAPQKYLVERIAGPLASVSALVRPGADPHSYEPSPSQMRACASAKVWFTIGVPFEDAWIPRIQGAAPGLAAVSLLKNVARQRFDHDGKALSALAEPSGDAAGASVPDHHEDHHHGGEDPHVWLSPPLVARMLPVIADELARQLPGQAETLRDNARALIAEFEALNRELEARFAPFPPDKRVFLSFHPSWNYFAAQYGLRPLYIESDGKEPGPRLMRAIIDEARRRGVSSVFVEPQFSRAAAEAIAANLGARVVTIDPLTENLPALYRQMADVLTDAFARNSRPDAGARP